MHLPGRFCRVKNCIKIFTDKCVSRAKVSEREGDKGARLKKFKFFGKNLFSLPEDSGRGSLASISTLVAQVSNDLVTGCPNITIQ